MATMCPRCGAHDFEHHCDPAVTSACDLVRCRNCRTFGTRDAHFWSQVATSSTT